MSTHAWKHGCDCCGRAFTVNGDTSDRDRTRCGMCLRRNGMCMHNAGERASTGVRAEMHSSRPHHDDTGAADPSTCQWCLAKLLDAWTEVERAAYQRNPRGFTT